MTDAPQVKPGSDSAPHEGSIRETLESIVIAFVLAFVFRAFVVEAFVIPTGSMAPTLLGEHMAIRSPDSGYSFTVDANGSVGPGRKLNVVDPMSGYVRGYPAGLRAGDRILVLKYIYAFREPRRWEVVVFKNPSEPEVNYIKRLVGLPQEQLWIVDGNIYTRPFVGGKAQSLDDPDGWSIQRKPHDVQRTVWQPVYHTQYAPLDAEPRGPRPLPWQPSSPQRFALERGPRWRFTPGDGEDGAALAFDFSEQRFRYNFYVYNQITAQKAASRAHMALGSEPIDDIRLAAKVMPAAEGLIASLRLRTRFFDIDGAFDASGRAVLRTRSHGETDAGWVERAAGTFDRMPIRRGTRIELWHVDQAMTMWVDGEPVASWAYDLNDVGVSLDLLRTNGPENAPAAAIGLAGAEAIVRDIELDRDLFYTQGRYDGTPPRLPPGSPPLGTDDRPAAIQADHFFCLGDNSPASADSRLWSDVDPWVAGLSDREPHEIPQHLLGYVPRELMIGRAFFVYFPAPYPATEGGLGVVPNFGKLRLIR